MLRITPSYSPQAAVAYFLEALSKEGGSYYLDQQVYAEFGGRASRLLGIYRQKITKEVFAQLAHNIHPQTGKRLTVKNALNRKAGYDYTFNASKSVSVLYSINQDDQILAAHQKAVDFAAKMIEADSQTQANDAKTRNYQDTKNLAWGRFDHFTARPVEDNGRYIPDPQLHSHLYIFNLTHNQTKDRFQAVELGNVHRQAGFYEALYHSVLSHELNQIGYSTRLTKDRFEIQGVSQAIIDKFSNRTHLINKIAQEKNLGVKEKAALGAKTRLKKDKSIKQEELDAFWRDRLTESELNTLLNLKGKHFDKPKPITPQQAIEHSLSHFLERNSTIAEKKLLAKALSMSYGTLRLEELQKALNDRTDIIRAKDNHIMTLTTQDMLHQENMMIKKAVEGKGKFKPINKAYTIQQEILNTNQRKAVHTLLNSKCQFNILKGVAGSGKTSLLSEVVAGARLAGKPVYGVAPSSQATQVLSETLPSHTIASLLTDKTKQQQLKDGLLIVDESGMCGVKTLSKIIDIARRNQTHVIFSGDTKQLGPVEYGDGQKILEQKAKLTTAQVNEVVRQKPQQFREAVTQISKGKTVDGFQKLDQMKAIVEIEDHDARIQKISEDYVRSISSKRSALIISPTHAEGNLISNKVRSILKEKGVIKGKERSFETLRSLSFTNQEKQTPHSFEHKQILRFSKKAGQDYKAGSHHMVVINPKSQEPELLNLGTKLIKPIPFEKPGSFEVYRQEQTVIAVGDKIRLTNNTYTLEKTKTNNGTTHTVKGFSKEGDIKLENGKTLSKLEKHFKNGYVETVFSSQGKTTQDCFISMSDLSYGATSQESFYVAVSRATHQVKLYTPDKSDLKKAIMKSTASPSASDIAEAHHERMQLERRQRSYHQIIQNKKSRTHEKHREQHPGSNRVQSRNSNTKHLE